MEETQADHGRAEAPARILSVSYDEGLLLTRNQLLRTTSTREVVSLGSLEEAVKQARSNDFELVILCHTIPEADTAVLIDEVRKRGKPPILVLSRGNYTLAQAQREGGGDGPSAFLRAVSAILGAQPGNPPNWLLHDPEKRIYRTR